MNTQLLELEKKYKELGEEIERLKKESVDDPIFLLSVEEYEKYRDRIPAYCGWWWLRSPGDCQHYSARVYGGGSVHYYGYYVNYDYVCVRPALNIHNLKSSNLKCVDCDTIIYCGITWKRIDDDLFIAEAPIATHRFDTKSNDYANSEVRQFLLDWYETRKNW